MKVKNRIIAALLFSATLLFTGCASSDGAMGHATQTNVTLDKANFKVVASVTGEASSRSIFGFGVNTRDLYNQARQDMVKKAGLVGNARVIANVTTDVRVRVGLFVVKKTVYLSGEVIEFTK